MNRIAAVNATLPQAMFASTGAGAPQMVTFARLAMASTTNGSPTATTHHCQPTRQRTRRAPNARYPGPPSVMPMMINAATSGPHAKNGVGAISSS